MRRWRSNSSNYSVSFLKRLERSIIRVLIIASVLLVLVQMGLGLAKDPVDFYISVAQKVEAPSMDLAPVSSTVTPDNKLENTSNKTWKLTLKASPAAPVRVLQNGRVLGTLTRGELEIPVQAGTLQLDGTNTSQIVRVQVVKKDAQLHDPRINQSLVIEHNVQNLRVGP
jgi:hypothetical protein